MKLFDGTLTQLERSLDARLLRHNVLAGNLANADTPGFQPLDVDVRSAVEASGAGGGLAVTHVTHLGSDGSSAVKAAVVGGPGGTAGLDGNGVDLDRTMAALAQNSLQYGAAAKAAGKKLAILRYVASDGAA